MEYKKGDRVEIINYGHPIWKGVEGQKNPEIIDLQPQLVGKKATIAQVSEPQPGHERYALDIDNYGYIAWFGLNQLKRS